MYLNEYLTTSPSVNFFRDLTYSSLSNASVSLVAEGRVRYSTIVLQQRLGDDPESNGEWFPVSVSRPSQLAMVCDRDENASSESDVRWRCESPRNVDVLFSLPDTAVLTGGVVRVDTIISHAPDDRSITLQLSKDTNKTLSTAGSKILSKHVGDEDVLSQADRSIPAELLLEISQSASYQFTHSSELRSKVLIAVRIGCLLLSSLFIVFWFWCMGINGFFLFGDCCCSCFYRGVEYGSEEEAMLKKRKKG